MEDITQFFEENTQWFVLGKGSNSLVSDSALTVPFVKLGTYFQTISHDSQFMTIGAGTTVAQLMSYSQKHGLTGLEFMAGVPASLGGMITMNFGCWGKTMVDIIDSVDIYIPNQGLKTLSLTDCNFDYRSSIFQSLNCLILKAKVRISSELPETVKQTITSYVHDRCEKQPMRHATFGSIFKNPPSQPAAMLIERCGFKGYELGTAKISNLHANFMENFNQASSQDALDLIELIQKKVYDIFNIKLIPEVHVFQ